MHVCAWLQHLGSKLPCEWKTRNTKDRYAVAVSKRQHGGRTSIEKNIPPLFDFFYEEETLFVACQTFRVLQISRAKILAVPLQPRMRWKFVHRQFNCGYGTIKVLNWNFTTWHLWSCCSCGPPIYKTAWFMSNSISLQKQVSCFNHRVVADKLKRQWLCTTYFADYKDNCRGSFPRLSYNAVSNHWTSVWRGYTCLQ